MPDSVQPHRQRPTKLPLPWDSPGKNAGVGAIVRYTLYTLSGVQQSDSLYTYLFFSDYFPICVTIEYWVDFLVLYSRSLFTIYFYIVVCVGYSHLLVYLSLPLSPLVAITLSLFLFCKWVHLYHFLESTWKWYHIFVFDFTYYDNLYVHPCC